MRIQRVWGLIAVAMVVVACAAPAATTRPSTAASAAASTAPTINPGTPAPPVTAPPATDAPPTDALPTDAPSTTPTGIGPGEGALNLVIWGGYAERGAAGEAFDWVTGFEADTGCIISTTDMTDSNNGVSLMQSGNYDGISASGDATTRLIQGDYVAPIDTSVFTNYANVFAGLKGLPHNTVDGVPYGVPHGRGPNLLMYNTETFAEAPTSWDVVWEDGADYAGQLSIYDSSIYIADAALHLMVKQPDLGITNPYQLNEAQFQAAVDLLEAQKANDPLYWGTYTDQMASYTAGDVVVGTSWKLMVNLLTTADPPAPVAGVVPEEGATGWSDTWMMAKDAANPNCMLLWMDHMMSAEANARATVFFGEASTSPEACAFAETLSPGHCDGLFADDEAYWSKIWYWSTPQADCADADEATACKTQDDWVEAWTTLRGS